MTSAGTGAMEQARRVLLKIHRWLGLALAAFLLVTGLTGIPLAYHDEIDRWLNPQLFVVEPRGERLSPLELRARAEQLVPQARATYVKLDQGPTDAALFYLFDRIDPATGKPHLLEADQLFLDPYTGERIGARLWGRAALDREHFMPFAFRLHRYLLLGEAGSWMLAVMAMAWLLSLLIAPYLASSGASGIFRVKARSLQPSLRLHRTWGLWAWPVLLTMAVGAVHLTLNQVDVYWGPLKAIAPVHDPGHSIPALPQPIDEPELPWEVALPLARRSMAAHAAREGFHIERETSFLLNPRTGAYCYSVHSSNDVHDNVGETELYLSARDGRELGFGHPRSAAGNTFTSWVGALHMARVGGPAYQAVVALSGVATVALAVTGLVSWRRRRVERR